MKRKHPLGIYATCDGEIYHVGEESEMRDGKEYRSKYGNRIYKRIAGSEKIELFGHLKIIFVTSGQPVKEGDLIGIMGTSGNSTAVHLHYDRFPDSDHLRGKYAIDPREHLIENTAPVNTKQTVGGGWKADYSHIYGRPYLHMGIDFCTELIEGWEHLCSEFYLGFYRSID